MISSDGGVTKLALFTGQPQGARETSGFHRVAFAVGARAFLAFLDRLPTLQLQDHQARPVHADAVVDHQQAYSIYFADPYGHRLEVTTYDYDAVRAALAGGAQLALKEVDDALERIEAERGGDRRPQVRVGVDVVEDAPAVGRVEVLDAADVQPRCPDDPRRGLDGRRAALRGTGRTPPAPRGSACAGTAHCPSPSSGLQTGDGHRLKRPCVFTRIA